jgi:hypothetical protein
VSWGSPLKETEEWLNLIERNKMEKIYQEEFLRTYKLLNVYDFFLDDFKTIDFKQIPYSNVRKLEYGLYDTYVDRHFVFSDKPDKIFTDVYKTQEDLNGRYYVYETELVKDFTWEELLIKTDFLIRRSGKTYDTGFNSFHLRDDGVLEVIMDS